MTTYNYPIWYTISKIDLHFFRLKFVRSKIISIQYQFGYIQDFRLILHSNFSITSILTFQGLTLFILNNLNNLSWMSLCCTI